MTEKVSWFRNRVW